MTLLSRHGCGERSRLPRQSHLAAESGDISLCRVDAISDRELPLVPAA